MALLRDYELPGTGLVAENAYHVVTNITIKKRIKDHPIPPDPSRKDGLTFVDRAEGTEVHWSAGYVAELGVTVWKNKEARDAGAKPVGFIGMNSSDNEHGVSIGTAGMDHRCQFMLEVPSELDHMAQSYRHLLTTDYYAGCVEI
jgi:hypothetical protein